MRSTVVTTKFLQADHAMVKQRKIQKRQKKQSR
uniref:Uncharacterized protein n=1 Tax=Anguilla anguilla TaxID=7936 RepID=A0A0E9QRS7_ANGAN